MMTLTNIQQFFQMGGYAVYVWGAYGVVGAVLMSNALWTLRRHRRVVRELSYRLKQTRSE